MANLSIAQIAGIVSLIAVLSGAIAITSLSDSYYCSAEDNVKECVKLSSTKTTCYTASGSDRCVGGKWEPLENFIKKESLNNGIFITTDGNNCYANGDLKKAIGC